MSAAKHRGPKGGSPPAAAANERGAQPSGAEEPAAKKPAGGHGRGGRAAAGGGGGRSGAGPRRGWALLLGAAVVLGAALPAGWYVRQLREEVGRSAREREASERQRQELAATLDTVVQKVARRRALSGGGQGVPGGRSAVAALAEGGLGRGDRRGARYCSAGRGAAAAPAGMGTGRGFTRGQRSGNPACGKANVSRYPAAPPLPLRALSVKMLSWL